MGILIDMLAIFLGGLLGGIFKERVTIKNFFVLGISIMIISMVGFLENIFEFTGVKPESSNLIIVVFALITGSFLGDFLQLDGRLSNISKSEKLFCNAIIDATLFFGVGGLQISGPVMLAANNDNSQLMLKSLIDFPFALIFGAGYGKIVSMSSLPVAVMQVIIALLTYISGDFLSDAVVMQICAMGYIVLFFSGFNLICEKRNKINNVNMLPGIFIILLFHIIGEGIM